MDRKKILFFSLALLIGWNLSYAQTSQKVAVLWIDPLASIQEISSRSGILDIVTRAKQSGIGAIALGVKAITGETIYESSLAPRIQEWIDQRVSFGADPVQLFLEEGRRRQLQIYAVFPVFSEGHLIERQGVVYDSKPEWQTTVYVVEQDKPVLESISDWASGTAAYVNPLLSDVQQYEIELVQEFIRKYSVDGIIFDNIQFAVIEVDFSVHTKNLFQASLEGEQIQWWPEDVFSWQFNNEEWRLVPGTLYQKWLDFRARSMHKFVERLVGEVNRTDATLPVGVFAGAWYPSYYEYGLNWASETNLIEESWATPEYYQTGIAEMLNYLVVGCYFPRISIAESEAAGADWWMSVEGSSVIAKEVVNQVCPVYASVLVPLFKQDGERFRNALITAMEQSNGLYIHDLSAVQRYNYWNEIGQVIRGQGPGRFVPSND